MPGSIPGVDQSILIGKMRGKNPSCPYRPSKRGETNEHANQAWNADPRKIGGASRDLTSAKLWMNFRRSICRLSPLPQPGAGTARLSEVRGTSVLCRSVLQWRPPHSCVLRSGVHVRKQLTRSSTLSQRVALRGALGAWSPELQLLARRWLARKRSCHEA